MSFSVAAYRLSDWELVSHPDPHSAEFGAWAERANQMELCGGPLGADGTVFQQWHQPAVQLGLQLLSRIYGEGLCVHGAELDELRRELDLLTRHWSATVADQEQHEYLLERRHLLWRAIDAAYEHEGYVVIS